VRLRHVGVGAARGLFAHPAKHREQEIRGRTSKAEFVG
jgi:hypothetical protein